MILPVVLHGHGFASIVVAPLLTHSGRLQPRLAICGQVVDAAALVRVHTSRRRLTKLLLTEDADVIALVG